MLVETHPSRRTGRRWLMPAPAPPLPTSTITTTTLPSPALPSPALPLLLLPLLSSSSRCCAQNLQRRTDGSDGTGRRAALHEDFQEEQEEEEEEEEGEEIEEEHEERADMDTKH